MNASDHLTTSQISRFAARALSVDESHAVGGICSGVPTDMEIAENGEVELRANATCAQPGSGEEARCDAHKRLKELMNK